jgi:hypothetical protein
MLPAGVYKPAATSGVAFLSMAAPVGTAPGTTMITEWGGSFSMVLPNYDFVRGCMSLNPAYDGGLSLCAGNVLAHNDGGIEPAVISGSWDGGTISGMVNDAGFAVSTTSIQNQSFTIPQMAGNYISTSSNNGVWLTITIVADNMTPDLVGHIQGLGYASLVDAQAGNTAKATGSYLGTISKTSVSISCATCVVPPNSFNIGFAYTDLVTGARHASTGGHAYFTTTGLVALTVNQFSGEQITAVFSKR